MAQGERQKVALVTGASSGIGHAVTRELATKGYKVLACARRIEKIDPLIKEFPEGTIVPVKLDIADPTEVARLKDRLITQSLLPEEKLDILYNNAGQSCTMPALDVSNEMMEQCFKVNVYGHINMCRELAQLLINSKGTIVFTGSLAGILPFPFGSIYAATKAAIHQYARVLHLEMKPFNVRVINAITGGVHTDIADTRDLPSSSVFNFEEGKEAFDYRKLMARNNNPMSPEMYAKEIVADILNNKDPVDVYRGTFASIGSFLMMLCPYWLLEFGIARKFKLDKVFAGLRKSSRTKLD